VGAAGGGCGCVCVWPSVWCGNPFLAGELCVSEDGQLDQLGVTEFPGSPNFGMAWGELRGG
jgi:hypothetical protein